MPDGSTAEHFLPLLQAQFLEKQYPNEVNVTEDEAAAEGYHKANDQANQPALLQEGGPSDYQLHHPVHNRDQEEDQLYQAALLIKPSHISSPFFRCGRMNTLFYYRGFLQKKQVLFCFLFECFFLPLADLIENEGQKRAHQPRAQQGDLDALLFPGKTLYDRDVTYDFEGLFMFTTAYSTPMDLVISARSGGTGKLLMFRDSFANAWVPYAASTFREIRLERVTPYRTDNFASFKPDFVVVEIAERNLGTLADAVGLE